MNEEKAILILGMAGFIALFNLVWLMSLASAAPAYSLNEPITNSTIFLKHSGYYDEENLVCRLPTEYEEENQWFYPLSWKDDYFNRVREKK